MKKAFTSLGPGLLFAGAAVGVSHLVQSTRAGAEFGFGLLWALVLVHMFKYPFFQYGPRYAAATGETLLDGYKKLGKGVLWCYYILNFATMFTIQAAVTIVTAGLAAHLFGLSNDLVLWSALLLAVSFGILLLGKYNLLDKLMKYIIITLTISTIIAVLVAMVTSKKGHSFTQIIPSGSAELTFLIAFLGWMPAPLDVSIWHSLWTVEKDKTTFQHIKPRQAIFDFNVGYIGTLFLGVCFLILGAMVMFQSGQSFSSKGSVFASQLINLYTKNLGEYAHIFIGIAAFTTMFSTTLTTFDASPRAMGKASELLHRKVKISYWFWSVVLAVGTYVILRYFMADMGLLVRIATVLSFLTAPFYAILNFLLISGKHTPEKYRPSKELKLLSIAGIVFLLGFSVWFICNL
ncbi:Iron transporter [Tenacibaculum litopenaei]|uniref:Nramp family divalent metal transporter n=1 Tax=Tenacibaculum litopenaei TaxID=396016 RepID=UPI0038961ACB